MDPFTQAYLDFIANKDVGPGAKLLWLYFAGGQDGVRSESIVKLATALRRSPPSIQTDIEQLERAGLLKIQRESGMVNVYEVIFKEGA